MSNKTWAAEQITTLQNMRKGGESFAAIAKRLEKTKSAIRSKWRALNEDYDASDRSPRQHLTPEELQYLYDALAAGVRKNVIRERLKCSPSTVFYHRRRALTDGLPLEVTPGRRWTESEIQYLTSAYRSIPTATIAKALRRSIPAIHERAHRIGISQPAGCAKRLPESEYFAAIGRASAATGISLADILRDRRYPKHAIIRWRAWHELSKRFSICALSRTSGYNHASIRYGLNRIAEIDRVERHRNYPCYNAPAVSIDDFAASTMAAQ
jgi:hypothetical protein